MKRRVLVLALGFAAALGLAPASALDAIPMHDSPRPLPEIGFTDEHGTRVTLEAWLGKVVVLNVWATWCGPCRKEMPTLDRLQGRMGDERFEVLALSIDRAGIDVVKRFFDEIGIAHLRPHIDESGRAGRELGAFGLPATILVGPDGRELGRLLGPAEWDTPEMIAFFEEVVAGHLEVR